MAINRRRTRWICCLALLALAGCGRGREVEAVRGVGPEIKPVATMVYAVETGDAELLASVFSERLEAELQPGGWERTLNLYQNLFRSRFGPDFRTTQFRFAFEGDGQSGKVHVTHEEESLPPLRVVREEDGRWALDER